MQMTYAEIGYKLGISRERVRQILNQVLTKIANNQNFKNYITGDFTLQKAEQKKQYYIKDVKISELYTLKLAHFERQTTKEHASQVHQSYVLACAYVECSLLGLYEHDHHPRKSKEFYRTFARCYNKNVSSMFIDPDKAAIWVREAKDILRKKGFVIRRTWEY